jgi:PAS domain-containing protein
MLSEHKYNQSQIIPSKIKGRSIALLLTTSIILTVACVSAISIFIGYMEATKKARAELERSLERNITAIVEILQVPLWNYDQETIENTGNLYIGNEDIVSLVIIDSLGQEMYRAEKNERGRPVVNTQEAKFEGHVAGTVTMGLSSRKYEEAIRQLLWSGIFTTVINLSVLILITGFLLRMFLKNPLNILSSIVNSYASGNYENTGVQLPYIEFQPVVDVIRSMGRKILFQIEELREAEQKYRSIFENAVEGIFQISREGKFLNANPSMAKTLGYESPDDLIRNVKRVSDQCFAFIDDFKRVNNELKKNGVISRCDIQGLKKMEIFYGFQSALVQ